MNRKLVFVFFIIFTSIFLVVYSISTTAAPPPPADSGSEEKDRIKEAVLQAIDGQREFVLGYLVNDVQVSSVALSDDESTGVIYLELVDPESGEILPTEPGLAFAVQTGADWEIILPTDPGWIDLVESAPQELLTDEKKISYAEMYLTETQAAEATYSGYLLPWEAGRTVYLSQSTGHDRYIPSGSAHYSFDFYISKTMYQIRAAKAGTVWRARWEVPNGNDDDMGNYLVLKDETTSPATYQLYLHLAKDSIPEDLRTVGTYVAQGQFIGVADDTGVSTGHHLHYHVHTNPNSYWGTSVDITFQDVNINGGRPRRESDLQYCTRPGDVCNQFRNAYVSGNVAPGDHIPPIGDLFEPATGLEVNSNLVSFDGWAFDDESGVSSIRLIAYFNDSWHEVGKDFTGTTFAGSWDMCTDKVPDGPVSLALKIRDKAGNVSLGLPGLTHIEKDYDCSQELIECIPAENQVAVYTSSDFQEICRIFGIGGYAQLSPDIDLNIESIRTGDNVFVEIFHERDYAGRSDTIFQNDSDLEDNPVRGDQVRSFIVSPNSSPLLAPQNLIYPLPGKQFNATESLSFSWRYSGSGKEFQVMIEDPSGDVYSEWLAETFWISDNLQLSEGLRSWKVRARSCPDPACEGPWSDSAIFEITPAPPALLSTAAPFTDTLESGPVNWSSTPMWTLINDSNRAHSSDHAWYYGNPSEFDYDTGSSNSGSLTSKPISIPGNDYQLKFWYRYETEAPIPRWDQRWVQISANGSPFENVLQLDNDANNFWLQAAVDLTPYAGQEIQIRFYFTTLDSINNANHQGWLIDDIEITQGTQPACNDGNDQPASAELINFNQTLTRDICPGGDIDYYRFTGLAGERVVLDIDTPIGDPVDYLDLYLFLLDEDGRSELAQHDDEILGTILDPHLGYQLKRDGTYYVRARLWSHPSHGGDEFDYQISLTKDNNPPEGTLVQPQTFTYINDFPEIDLAATASDNESGIQKVEFWYHSADWQTSDWELLDIDQDGTDGWGLTLDANNFPEQDGAAFFAKVYDWAGNWDGSGAWEIGFDRTQPVTGLQNLLPDQGSTAFQLQWNGADNLSGMNFYQLQFNKNGAAWENLLPSPTSAETKRWFIGQAGSSYGFRIRGVDIAGNLEDFPVNPETSTSIPNPATLCSSPDPSEGAGNDNSPENSSPVDLASEPAEHNFCNPLAGNRLNDEDWVNFEVEVGQVYLLESLPTAEMTASIIELYASDGTTLLASDQAVGFNESSRIIWTSDRSGKVLLRVRHIDGRVAGNIVTYKLKVHKFLPIFMPFIHR